MGLYAIKDAGDLIFSDPTTGEVAMILDYANSFEISLSADTEYATAKGQNRISFEKAKEGSLSISTQMGDASMFAMILGSEVVKTTSDVHIVDKFTIAENQITLSQDPKEDSICILLTDERKLIKIGELATETEATLEGREITFASTHNGKNVKVYYLKSGTNVNKITVKANSSSKAYKLTAICEGKLDVNNDKQMLELILPKVKPKSNITFGFNADAPSEFSIELDLLSDSNDTLLEYNEIL